MYFVWITSKQIKRINQKAETRKKGMSSVYTLLLASCDLALCDLTLATGMRRYRHKSVNMRAL